MNKQKTILIVDDNLNNLFTFQATLESQKWHLISCQSGQEALKALLKHPIDLILMDVQMPEMNGFETAQLIKQNKKLKDIPIIFITAVCRNDEFVKQGFSVGAYDYLTKPVESHVLINKIKVFLKLQSSQQALLRINETLQDEIQNRIQSEERSIVSERDTANIIAAMDEGLVVIDPVGNITRVNSACIELLGYQEYELLGKPLNFLVEEKVDGVWEKFAGQLSRVGLQSHYDASPTAFMAMLAHTPWAVLVCDEHGKVVFQNQQVKNRLGYDEAMLYGEMIECLVPSAMRQRYQENGEGFYQDFSMGMVPQEAIVQAQHANGGMVDVRVSLIPLRMEGRDHVITLIYDVNHDLPWSILKLTEMGQFLDHESERDQITILNDKYAQQVPVVMSCTPMFDAAQAVSGFVVLMDNRKYRFMIEQNYRMREALEQSQHQRLESLGLLAGGIAHDFNNLLTPIIGNAELLMAADGEGSRNFILAQQIMDAAQHAARLSKQMLSYAGSGRLASVTVHLPRLIENIASVLNGAAEAHGGVHFSMDNSVAAVDVDIAEVEQILLNMVINGADAIGHNHGHIAVKVYAKELNDFELHQYIYKEGVGAGSYIALEIEDNGSGMSSEVQRKLFDPFFTTKFTGRGLGMSAVLGIVHSHQGLLRVRSTVAKGTTFTVLFPVSEQGADAMIFAQKELTGELAILQGNVLIVDDDLLVNAVLKSRLEALGCSSLQAYDGEHGLALYREHGDDIDAIILDMTMPGMSGFDCFKALKSINEDVVVIISSGYAQGELETQFGDFKPNDFLEKPYTLSGLATILRQHLPL
ncbi:MAG: response regulator [Zetaproteobacteria bacterium]|nr:response regulator [Zetaproteobacteria bacterium]